MGILPESPRLLSELSACRWKRVDWESVLMSPPVSLAVAAVGHPPAFWNMDATLANGGSCGRLCTAVGGRRGNCSESSGSSWASCFARVPVLCCLLYCDAALPVALQEHADFPAAPI